MSMRARTLPSREQLASWAWSDAAGLVILAVAMIARGVSYTPVAVDTARAPAHTLEAWLPMGVWATVWIAVGGLCLLAVITRRSRRPIAAVAVGYAAGLHMLWGWSFTMASLSGSQPRGWVTALGYFTVALLVFWAFGRGGPQRVVRR